MKTTVKNETAKKQLQTILKNEAITDSIYTTIRANNFTCTFHKDLTNDDLTKRAAAFDRSCYHEKKINGGLAVQAAIAFILNHKENAKKIVIKSSNKNSYSWVSCCSWFAFLGKEKLCAVTFNDNDYDYALEVMRI